MKSIIRYACALIAGAVSGGLGVVIFLALIDLASVVEITAGAMPPWPFVAVFVAAWAISTLAIARGADSVLQVISRAFLVAAVEGIAGLFVVGIFTRKAIIGAGVSPPVGSLFSLFLIGLFVAVMFVSLIGYFLLMAREKSEGNMLLTD